MAGLTLVTILILGICGLSSAVNSTKANGKSTYFQRVRQANLRASVRETIAEDLKKLRHSQAKAEHVYFSQTISSLHQQAEQMRRHKKHHKVNLCNGNRYEWMVETRQGCKDSYGEASVWDNDLADGGCGEAWDECNTDFASTCCTQPEGPRDMDAYCARAVNAEDRACAVQNQVADVQGNMNGIRDAVSLMNTRPAAAGSPTLFTILSGDCRLADGGRCVVSPNFPEDYENDGECEIKVPTRGVLYPGVKVVTSQMQTEGCCDRLTLGDEVYGGGEVEDGPDHELKGEDKGSTMTWETDFSSPSAGWKVCAEDVPPAPPPPPPALCLQDFQQQQVPSPAPSPGSGPMFPVNTVPGGPLSPAPSVQRWVPCPSSPGPAPGPGAADARRIARRERRAAALAARKTGPRKPTKLEMQCRKLTDLVHKAGQQLDSVKTWAEHDGIVAATPAQGHPAPHTASLFAKGMSLVLGRHYTHNAAAGGTSEAKDPDLTFAVQGVLAVGAKLNALRNCAFCGAPPAAADLDDDVDDGTDDAEDDKDDDLGDNETDADEDVKVNGTAVAGVLEFDAEMDGATTKFQKNVHPSGNKWWRYRYEYTLVESLVLAFSVMFLYLVMWVLSGVSFFDKFKFYNIGITARLFRYAWGYLMFHAAALMIMVTLAYMLYMPWGDENIFDYFATWFHKQVDGRANVPFKGYSWLLMVLDVQFQLFVTFALYALFIVFVTQSFARALDDWKAISDNEIATRSARLPINDYHYTDFHDILTHRVKKSNTFVALFGELRLRYRAVQGVDSQRQPNFNDFKLHLYLTDSFGKALEYLVEVSLKANIALAVAALAIALLAHHYQVAFMYFLPIFIVFGLAFFGCSYFVSRALRNHNHDMPLDQLTVHHYCRSIQMCLYCVFFSFSRLLLSADIFTDYPKVYLSAVIGLLIALLLGKWVAGELMKATICAIVLPHHSQEDRFKMNLQHVVYWHTTENCHECGVRQAPPNASLSREWAGTKVAHGDIPQSAVTSGREFSFRG